MISVDTVVKDTSTPIQKLTAAASGLCFACLTFFFAALVLIPITGSIATALAIPDALAAWIVFFELFGLPSISGVFGVAVVAHGIASKTLAASQN